MGAYVSTNNLYNSVSTKILLKIYPYFHNKNDIELSSNLCKLVMSNQNKFKEYLIYILQNMKNYFSLYNLTISLVKIFKFGCFLTISSRFFKYG